MADDLNIKNVFHTSGFNQPDFQKKKKKKDKRPEDEAKDHFTELTRSADQVHEILLKKNSPYRFCIYREKQEIFIDLVILNADGDIDSTIKKNITHQEFSEIIRNIEMLDGLIIDTKA